jgi:hypothetical protein
MVDNLNWKKILTDKAYAWKSKYSNMEIEPTDLKIGIAAHEDFEKRAYNLFDICKENLSMPQISMIMYHELLHVIMQQTPRGALFNMPKARDDMNFAFKAKSIKLSEEDFMGFPKLHDYGKRSNDVINSEIGVCSGCGITNEYQTGSYICFSCKG